MPIRGHLSGRAVSALMDGELDLMEVREARLHLSRCDACRAGLREMEEVDCLIALAGSRGRPRPGIREGLVEGIRSSRGASGLPARSPPRPRAGLAAAAVLIAFLIAAVSSVYRDDGGAVVPESARTSIRTPPSEPPERLQGPPGRPAAAPCGEETVVIQPGADPVPPPDRGEPFPSLEFVITMARAEDPSPPVEDPPAETPPRGEAGMDLAINPDPSPIVQEEEVTASAVRRTRLDDEAREVSPWIALSAIPIDRPPDLEPTLRFRDRRPMARDLVTEWPDPSEERPDYFASVGITLPGWN